MFVFWLSSYHFKFSSCTVSMALLISVLLPFCSFSLHFLLLISFFSFPPFLQNTDIALSQTEEFFPLPRSNLLTHWPVSHPALSLNTSRPLWDQKKKDPFPMYRNGLSSAVFRKQGTNEHKLLFLSTGKAIQFYAKLIKGAHEDKACLLFRWYCGFFLQPALLLCRRCTAAHQVQMEIKPQAFQWPQLIYCNGSVANPAKR